MNRSAQNAVLGTRLGAIDGSVTSGTTLVAVSFSPAASATTTSINAHKLFAIGDVTGNTAYGMGDPAKPTTGIMASFGRTALATGTFTDTAADFRIINKLVDTTGVHSMQGLYVKAKNYSGATLTGNLYGAFIETVADGTVDGQSAAIKLGTDATRVNRMIDAGDMLLTKYTSNKAVVLLKFVDAAGTTQYLVHNTDAATVLAVTSSAPS
ncbi:MAG: hypothetical protein WA061_02270 [Microgenomates group bacterium]